MEFVIHRGSHQIGGSCVEVRHDGTAILLDIGLPLDFDESVRTGGRNTGSVKELLKQKVLPDIKGIYRGDRRKPAVDAILISHPHLDHYGILRWVKPDIPVCMGQHAWSIIVQAAKFINRGTPFNGTIAAVESGVAREIAGFRVTPFLMDHWAFDAYAYLVEADGKSLLYSGDFRSHGRKHPMSAAHFREFGVLLPTTFDGIPSTWHLRGAA